MLGFDRFFRLLITLSLILSTVPASFLPNRTAAAQSIGESRQEAVRIAAQLSEASYPVKLPAATTATVPISVTAQGFTPSLVTITVGATVAWMNLTGQAVTVRSGQPFRVYLPLISKGGSGQALDAKSDDAFLNGDDFMGVILPSGTFTHTFNNPGLHPYFLVNSPNFTGQVIVQPVAFAFSLGVSPESQAIRQGQIAAFSIPVTGTLGDPQAVNLNVGGLPVDAAWSLTPASVVPTNTATLIVTTTLTTSIGSYVVGITGTAGSQVHTTTATLSVNPHPDFTLSAQPSTQSAPQGTNATYTITTHSQYGFNQPVMFNVAGLPSGASAVWSMNPITPTANSALRIDVLGAAPTGIYPLTITGVGGGFTHTTAATLTVTLHDGFTLRITPDAVSIPQGTTATYAATVAGLYDFTSPVTLSVSGLPDGVTGALLPNPVIPTSTATISLTAALTTPLGTHSLSLIGTGGERVHSVPFTLTLTPHPDFALGAQPSTLSVRQSRSVTTMVNASALYSFTGPVTLTIDGLPAGAAAHWAANPIAPDAATTLTLTTSLATPPGNHVLIVIGTGGGFTHAVPVTLTVLPHPDFTFAVTPPTQAITQGQAITYAAQLIGLNDWTAPVALSLTGTPTDTVVTWQPDMVTPDGRSVLSLSVDTTTPAGSYPLTAMADGGLVSHTAALTLVVTLHEGFALEVTPHTASTPQGAQAGYTATVAGLYGFVDPVTLALDGLPAGASAAIAPNPVQPTGTAHLTLTTALTVPVGDYALTLIGTGSGRTHSVPFTLTLTPHPDFALGAQPSTFSVRQSRSVTTSVNASALHGFTGPVTLTIDSLPAGTAAHWAANPIAPDAGTTLTLTTSLATPPGNHALIVTGTGGGFTHIVPVTLTVLPHPDFTFAVTPATQAITQGQVITYAAQLLGLNDWNAPVALSLTGAPVGAAGTWLPDSLTPDGGSVLGVSVAITTPAGLYPMQAVADGGLISHTASLTLVVNLHQGFTLDITPATASTPQGAAAGYTATVSGLFDFTDPVTLSVSGLPAGVTADMAPNPVMPTNSAHLTLTAALTVPVGDYALTLIGAGSGRAHSVPFALTITPHPDFALSASPDWAGVRQSRAVTTQVDVAGLYGFTDAVTLSISGLPAGSSAQWANQVVSPGNSTPLTLTTSLATPLGVYPLTITGNGGGFVHTMPFTLTVSDHPDFAFSLTPPTQAITQGQSTTYAAQLSVLNDWNVPVALSLTGTPTGTVATWLPEAVTPNGNSTLSLDVGVETPVGVYALTAWADGGSISHAASITLTVLEIPKPDLIVEVLSTNPITPTANKPVTLTARVRNVSGAPVAQSFDVDWYVDPATAPITTTPGTGTWTVSSLGLGASVDLTATTTFTPVGAHTVWAQVDRTGVITESNENNNVTGPITVTAGLPDLLISSLTTLPSIPVQGRLFTLTAVVNNSGPAAADAFAVDYYLDPPAQPDAATPGDGLWTVGGLNASSAVTLIVSRTLSSVGLHSLWAQADRENAVAESNEGNNLSHSTLFFVDRAPLAPTPFMTPTPMPTPQATPATGSRQPVVNVPATISANTTWVSGTVYVIAGRVTLNAGVTLNIEPGAVIKFQTQTVSPYYKGRLTINGTLLAPGTAAAPIVFTSIHDDAYGGDTNTNGGATWPNASDWDGLEFTNTSSGSVLDNVRVTFGGGNGSNVQATGASVNLSNSTIRWSSGDGLRWLNGSSGQISGNQIGNNLGSGLNLTSSSSPIVHDNTLANNRTYAVYLDGSCFPDFDNNAVYGNAWNAAGVYGTVGTGTWTSNLAYYATQNLSIEAANALTIQPSTTVKFAASTTLIVRGTLIASGTVTSPIIFTSVKDDQYGGDTQQDGGATKPTNGDWGTLYFADTSNDANTILNSVIVRYGGAGYNYGSGTSYADITLDSAGPRLLNSFVEHSSKYGLQLLNASSPLIQGNTIWENNDTGLWLSSSSSPTVDGNAFVRNNGYAVYVNGSTQATFAGNVAAGNKTNGIGTSGTINADTTWNSNLPFVIEGSVTLALNTTLNIQPDTVVKFTAGGKLIVNGWLQALGTSAHRITFTSLKDDTIGGDTNNDAALTTPAAGNWESIRFMSTSSASALDYVSVLYGGSNAATGAFIVDSSTPSLGHLIVMGSPYRGLYALNTSVLIDGGVFAQNGYGVYNETTAYLIVHNSDIFSNTTYGLYNANTGYALNATNNWWGSATGPKHASNPGGTGDAVSNNVTFSPWLATPPVTQPAALPVYAAPPGQTQVSGAIAVNTTWTAANSPYIVIGDVTVNAGVQLTIQPDVVVKFAVGKSLIINGILSAEGLSTDHIIFTSIKDDSVGGDSNADGSASAPARGDWGRLAFGDTSVDALTQLRYAEVRYGGSLGSALYLDAASPTISDNTINLNSGYGLHVRNNSNPSIQRNTVVDNAGGGLRYELTSAGTLADNVIWGNSGYAVYMDTTCYPALSGNTAYYNDVNGVRVSGSVTFNQTWYANLPYVIEGGVIINSGPALTLQPGTVVKFKDTTSYLTVNGALIASGTISNPIIFTSLRDDASGGDTDNDDGIFWPLPGDWQRITFTDTSDDSRTTLRYTQVRYGGATYNQSIVADSAAPKILSSTIAFGSGYGLYLLNQANPQIQSNTFLQNGLSGLYLASASAPTVNGNTFQRNKSYAVEMTADTKPRFNGNVALDNGTNGVYVSGTTSGSTTWDDDLTYVAGNVTIPSGASLTLSPGNVVKFLSAANWTVNGPLYADGTSALSITLTSLKDDTYGGDTNNDGSVSTPVPGDWGTITIGSTANASRFSHAVIRYGGDPTIKVSVSSLTVTDSVLDFNKRALWYDQSTGTITGTKFLSNTEYGLYETSSGLTIDSNEFDWNKRGAYVRTATVGHTSISNNVFEDNQEFAISMDFAGFLLLSDTNQYIRHGAISNAVWVVGNGSLTQNWILHADVVYRLDSVTVITGTTLSVQPGAVLKFASPNAGLSVFGNLSASGTVTNPVVFTSFKDDSYGGDTNSDGSVSTPAKGDWGTILLRSSSTAMLDYTVSRYGGYGFYHIFGSMYCSYGSEIVGYDGLIQLQANANLSIQHSTVSNSMNAGIYASGANIGLSMVESTISNNGTPDGYYAYCGEHWYYDRQGVYYDSTGGKPVFSTLTIQNNLAEGIKAGTLASATLNDNIFTNNGSYAAYLRFSNGTFPVNSGNSGVGNAKNGIGLIGTLTGTMTMANNPGFPYIVDGNLQVQSGSNLTLQPGTIVKFTASDRSIHVFGALTALGTSTNPIVFTSFKDDTYGGDTNNDGGATSPAKGDWGAILLENGATADFDYAIVRYGGYGFYHIFGSMYCSYGSEIVGYDGLIQLQANANLSIQHSTVSNSMNAGIYASGANIGLSMVESTISNNGTPDGYYAYCGEHWYYDKQGVYYDSSATGFRATSNSIMTNLGYGVQNGNLSTTLDARYNWWGDASGPTPFGTGNGINYRTYTCGTPPVTCYDFEYYVHVNPWLGEPVPANNPLPAGSSVVGSYNSSPSVSWSGWVAEPVNVVFGNYIYQHTDLSFPGRGLGFAFERTYNSNIMDVGPLGLGWTHSYNITATQASTFTVIIRRADGRLDQFAGSGIAFTPPPGNHDTLAQIGSTFVLTQADQTVLTFDTSGRLASMKDRNNNSQMFAYSGGNLSAVTLADGRVVNFTYTGGYLTGLTDPAGRTVNFGYTGNLLTSFTDTAGQTTTYAYDGSNRLQSITDANGHTFVDNTYDADGRVVQQLGALNDLTTFSYYTPTQQTVVVDPLGNPVTYTYDSAYRITSERDALGNQTLTQWDSDNNRIAVTDKRGNTMRYAYDARGNATIITDTLGLTRTFAYDTTFGRNNLTSATDQLLHTTVYTYTVTGNPITQADPAGNLTRWRYDAYGQVISQTDALSGTTRYAYDLYGNRTLITDALTNTTVFTYDIVGRKLSQSDPRGNTTSYAYDAVARLRVVTDALGYTTVYTYDAVGNRLAAQDALGRVTQAAYDAKDRLAVATDTLGNATRYAYDANNNQTIVTDTLGQATTYGYDALNRRTSATDPLGKVSHYQYDANGNLTLVINPQGQATTTTYDALNRPTYVANPLGYVVTTTYDAVGNILTVTDPNGQTTTNTYDALKRLINVSDALSGTIAYTYDAVDNRTAVTDANGHVTTYLYDTLNRLMRATDPLAHFTSYAYDAAGNRVTMTDANGAVITNTFDALNRLMGTEYADGTSVAYAYDAVANRVAMTDTTGTTTYVYDNLNRPLTIASPQGTVTYTYNAMNRTSLTTSAGTTTYTYDPADRLSTVTDWATRVTTYTYDDAGRQIGIAYPNGVTGVYTHDAASRITGMTYNTGGSTLAAITYTLDAVGNRLSMNDFDGATTYTYDALNRLTGVTYPGGSPTTVAYAYDPMGNRLTKVEDSTTTVYAYNDVDQLLSTATGGITTTFTWDANSNQLTKGTQTFTWDKVNRLTGWTDGVNMSSYQYTGDGVRVGRTVNGITTTYLQDQASGLPVVLRETTGVSTTNYLYGTDQVASIDGTGTSAFYHADALGSVRLLTDASGSVSDQYSYDAFGASRAHAGSSSNPFTFAGEQADPEAGLIYLRARYYDPETGRFTSPDELGGFVHDTQSINPYLYAGNNPTLQSDPAGLAWQLFAGLEGGFMLGPVKIGGGAKTNLGLNGGMPDVYVSGSGGAKVGFGLDASLGPKVGVAYEGSSGLRFMPDWLQIKGGQLKLPFVEIGGTVTRDKFKIEASLRTGVGVAVEAQGGVEVKGKSSNLKGKLGDWLFDTFAKPGYDAEANRIAAEHQQRMAEIEAMKRAGGNSGFGRTMTFGDLLQGFGAGLKPYANLGGAKWGGPPSDGK